VQVVAEACARPLQELQAAEWFEPVRQGWGVDKECV
jgi:hypothetical protein